MRVPRFGGTVARVPILRVVPSNGSEPMPQPEPLPLGSITPRLWTRPLRKLTPRTSYGFAVIHFAATVLLTPLDPWQQWLVIHAGEMLDDGRPRFRQVLVIVARQNGKTHLCKILALFWMFVEKWPMIFGTSTNLEQAKEAWEEAVTLAQATKALAERIPRGGVRVGNGQQVLSSTDRSRYKIGAADKDGGRGKSIDRAIGDELRQQRTWEAYQAAYNAMNLRPLAQVVYITNMGDKRSVVLNSLRRDALAALDSDQRRPVFIAEWSAPPGTHPADPAGHAAANPQYGRRMDPDVLIAAARRVSAPGADLEELNGFLTEILCMQVDHMDPAVSPANWTASLARAAIDLDARGQLAAVVDVAPDQQHVSLVVAARAGEQWRVEAVASWAGPDAMARALDDLPAWIVKVRPKVVGWFPGGPAATLDATLRDRRKAGTRGRTWPPRGVTVQELTAEVPAVCMGFAAMIDAGQLLHSGQDLLDVQVAAAGKLWLSESRWVFGRDSGRHVDAVYAAAGALHLARTMPRTRKVVRGVRTGT